METAKKVKPKKKAAKMSAESILSAYRVAVLSQGSRPASVFKFSADLGITESDFYSYFASFDALERSIWSSYLSDVVSRLSEDKAYASFSAREKVLSFHFTLMELLRNDRSFVLYQFREAKMKAVLPSFLKSFKAGFEAWIAEVLAAGKASEEIAQRPYLDKAYDNLFWIHLMFILRFWSHDESRDFEKTDAAIEKSVNLAFDLIGKGVLDNALDFGKFLYQNAKN